MRYRVIIRKSAEAQIQAIYEYHLLQAPAFADRWIAGLAEAIDSLQEMPHRCPPALEDPDRTEGLRHLLYGAWRIVYRVHGSTVRVLYIRHTSQQASTTERNPRRRG